MNLLTDVTTKIQNSIRKDSTLKDELAIGLQNQIRLVKEEIVIIKFAIQWARRGVMNTFLLNEFELKEIDSLLKINNMPTSALEEIDDGLIWLNDFNGTVNWRDIERRLSGTYLITFLNETLKINGREFSNNEVASKNYPNMYHVNSFLRSILISARKSSSSTTRTYTRSRLLFLLTQASKLYF